MKLRQSLALCILGGMVLIACQTSQAQEAAGGGDQEARAALKTLKDAPSYLRSQHVAAIVELGQPAVPLLVEQVRAFRSDPDVGFTGHCIRALGILRAAEATDALIEALNAHQAQLRYFSAEALGEIWTGRSPDQDTLRKVNAALLASVLDSRGSPAVYGPGLALIDINGVSVAQFSFLARDENRKGKFELDKAEYLETDEIPMVATVWAMRNPGRFPPVEQQPWQMVLERAIRSDDAAQRREARDVLVRRSSLEAIGAILGYLREEDAKIGDAQRRELGDLLTAISGVEFPPAVEDATRSELAAAWLDSWIESLKSHGEEHFRLYAWRSFERAVDEVDRGADDAAHRELTGFQDAVLFMMDSPRQLPKGALPAARALVADRLAAKESFLAYLDGLKKAERFDEKDRHIQEMLDSLLTPEGREMARLFTDDLAGAARTEQNRGILRLLAELMTDVSGVTIRLDYASSDQRLRAIDEWLEAVERQGAEVAGAL